MIQKLSEEQLEYRVRQLREAYDIKPGIALDVRNFLKKYLSRHLDLKFQVVEDWELPRVEAQTYAIGKSIKVRKSLFERFEAGDPRAEVIILEELAHYMFQHSGIRNRAVGDRDTTVQPRGIYAAEEWQAKYFAVALKSPLDDAARCTSAEQLQERFRLSKQAARIRWEEVERHKRKISRQGRPIDAELVAELDQWRRRWGSTKKTTPSRSDPPKEIVQAAARFSAVAQGYSGTACTNCSNYTIVETGRCHTCSTCGDSDCN
jgi:hypothetical protein